MKYTKSKIKLAVGWILSILGILTDNTPMVLVGLFLFIELSEKKPIQ